LKAITSTKLSPSSRYALVGYGVRQDRLVQGHVRPDATCEVFSLLDGDMSSVALFCDKEDEVGRYVIYELSRSFYILVFTAIFQYI